MPVADDNLRGLRPRGNHPDRHDELAVTDVGKAVQVNAKVSPRRWVENHFSKPAAASLQLQNVLWTRISDTNGTQQLMRQRSAGQILRLPVCCAESSPLMISQTNQRRNFSNPLSCIEIDQRMR